MNVRELYLTLGDLIAEEPRYAQYEVLLEGCDCFGSVSDVDMGYQGVLILKGEREYDEPLCLTPERAKVLEEEQEKIKAALNKRLLDQIKPEFRDLLP